MSLVVSSHLPAGTRNPTFIQIEWADEVIQPRSGWSYRGEEGVHPRLGQGPTEGAVVNQKNGCQRVIIMNYCCVCCHKLHKTYMINMSCYPYKIIQVLLENRWQCVQIDVAPPKGGPPPPAGNPLNRGKKGGCWVGAIRPPPPDCFYTGRAQPYSYAMSGIVRNSKSGGVGRCAHPDRFATPPRQPRRVWE